MADADAPPEPASDGGWETGVVVPDDARALAGDVAAYHRERRAARRRRRLRALQPGLRPGPRLFTAGLLALGLATAGLAVLLRPAAAPVRPPHPVALARWAGTSPRTAGGLVPDVTVTTADGPRSIRALRPALVALLPTGCACAALVDDLAAQADEFTLPLVLVAAPAAARDAATFAAESRRGRVTVVVDPRADLRRAYAAGGVTVLVLAADGRVVDAVRSVGPRTRLESLLYETGASVG